MKEEIQIWVDITVALIALAAFIVAYVEHQSQKKTNEHKLFSQLNRRYHESEDLQCVVKYLRAKEPSEQIPTLYQVELFLRFFEEIGMYMTTGSLDAKNIDRFFGYYLRQLYLTPRGQELLGRLEGEDRELYFLNILKQTIKLEHL